MMRWAWYAILGVLLNGSHPRLSETAYAVMSERSELPPAASDSQPRPIRLDIPVHWQLTRSKLVGPGATTLTESFRETWTIEITPNARVFLISPRARVPAYQSAAELADGELPKSLLISEMDLARLVGIKPEARQGEEIETVSEPAIGRPLTLQLAASPRAALDVSLAWSDEAHYAVQINVGTAPIF